MFRRSLVIVIYLLFIAAFTNVASIANQNLGINVLPIIFILAAGLLFWEITTSKEYYISSYGENSTYVISFSFLLLLTLGLINADISKSFGSIIYPLITNFFIFHLIICSLKKREELEGALIAIMFCAPLLMLQGFGQFFTDMFSAAFDFNIRAQGWWDDPNTYAFTLDLIYLVTFYFLNHPRKALRALAYIGQISAFAGVFLSLSRGGMIVFLLITLLGWRDFFENKAYVTSILVIFAVTIGVLVINPLHLDLINNINIQRFLPNENYKGDYSNGREQAAMDGLRVYALHPLAGVGFGNVSDHIESLYNIRMNTHNMYIEILAAAGSLPFCGYVIMLFYLFQITSDSRSSKINALFHRFIIALTVMGFFAHYLLYLKTVWVLLALIPVFGGMIGGESSASSHSDNQV